MTRIIPLALLAMATASSTLAAPTSPVPRSPSHHTITRRSAGFKDLRGDDLVAWTQENTAHLRNKYASKLKSSNAKLQSSKKKRDTAGEASLVNYENDSTFYSTIEIGTPSQEVTMILDTGSSDIWAIAGRNSWTPSQSSTFENTTTAFTISYGSGSVQGTLATDTITLAGHTSSTQTLAIATEVTQGLLDTDVDGIMGFGFKSLSTSGATPFWQASGADEFAFYLRSDAVSTSSSSSPTISSRGYSETQYGGIFTLGGTNSSLYQGDINWSDVIDESYWLITLGGITVNGVDVSLSDTDKVAVDTGTTLIGAPTTVVEAIYAQIPDSSTLSSDSGYYQFPCTTNVNATIHLGDQEYALTSADLIAGTIDSSGETCMGSFFSIGSDESDELQYILGDTFLTMVYTIFSNTGTTAQVGFASLADGLGTSTSSTTVNKVIASSGATSTFIKGNAWTLACLATGATLALLA